MRKGFFVFGILAIFLFNFASIAGLTVDIQNDYSKSETALVRIYGDIKAPITKENVNFYRAGHILVPFEHDVKKIGNDYYLWFITGNENNYTMNITDIATTVNGATQTIYVEKNFSVSQNQSSYYISPGVVSTNQDFEINVYSNLDSSSSISSNFPQQRSIIIQPGMNKVSFSISSLSGTTITSITLGKYNIPAYIIKSPGQINDTNQTEVNQTGNQTTSNSSANISISPERIQRSEFLGSNLSYNIQLKNIGNGSAENVSFSYNNKVISISPEFILNMSKNASANFSLRIRANVSINEIVLIKYGNNSIMLPVIITLKNPTNLTGNQSNNLFDCTIELGGKVCNITNEKCTGDSLISKQGQCCQASCAIIEKKTNNSWVGWLLAIAALAIVGFIFYRYKNVRSIKNPLPGKVKEIESKKP